MVYKNKLNLVRDINKRKKYYLIICEIISIIIYDNNDYFAYCCSVATEIKIYWGDNVHLHLT